jgi:hypothetical protein
MGLTVRILGKAILMSSPVTKSTVLRTFSGDTAPPQKDACELRPESSRRPRRIMQERNFGKGTIYPADKCEGRESIVAIIIISNPDSAANASGV